MTPTELLAPTYIQMLGALSQWLDKASAQLNSSSKARPECTLNDELPSSSRAVATSRTDGTRSRKRRGSST